MFESGPVYVPTGATEPVEVQVTGLDNLPLTGKTSIKICVRRISDGFYLDWTDNTFKVGNNVVQMLLALTEVSATYSPGVYELDTAPHQKGFNTAALTNAATGDVYDLTVVQDGEYDAPGLPVGFEIKLGAPFADKIEDLPASVAAAVWDEEQLAHIIAGSFGDAVRRILALQKENYFIDQMAYNSRGLLLGGRIRIFPDKATALAATKDGSNEGEIGVYSFTTTEVAGHIERAETARSVRDA